MFHKLMIMVLPFFAERILRRQMNSLYLDQSLMQFSKIAFAMIHTLVLLTFLIDAGFSGLELFLNSLLGIVYILIPVSTVIFID